MAQIPGAELIAVAIEPTVRFRIREPVVLET
jgi:hypothetical protein